MDGLDHLEENVEYFTVVGYFGDRILPGKSTFLPIHPILAGRGRISSIKITITIMHYVRKLNRVPKFTVHCELGKIYICFRSDVLYFFM